MRGSYQKQIAALGFYDVDLFGEIQSHPVLPEPEATPPMLPMMPEEDGAGIQLRPMDYGKAPEQIAETWPGLYSPRCPRCHSRNTVIVRAIDPETGKAYEATHCKACHNLERTAAR